MAITTTDELKAAFREAVTVAGGRPDAIDEELWERDVEIAPRVLGDDRWWRVAVDGIAEPRVIDSESIVRELAFVLIANPETAVTMWQADADEAKAYELLGAAGLKLLDERRAAQDAVVQAEVAEALDIALGGRR